MTWVLGILFAAACAVILTLIISIGRHADLLEERDVEILGLKHMLDDAKLCQSREESKLREQIIDLESSVVRLKAEKLQMQGELKSMSQSLQDLVEQARRYVSG